MSESSDYLKEILAQPGHENKLYRTAAGEFFILYGSHLAYRGDLPDEEDAELFCSVSADTAESVQAFCREAHCSPADLPEIAENSGLNDGWFRPEEAGGDEVSRKARQLCAFCAARGLEPERFVRAAGMLADGCQPGLWYLPDEGNLSAWDSVAEYGEVLNLGHESEETEAYWLEQLKKLGACLFDAGEVL